MGLDQYAYVYNRAGAKDEYWSDENCSKSVEDPSKLSAPHEIAYWRKHPNLQGWMENLWRSKNPDAGESFNCIELELTSEDLDRLEHDILTGQVSKLDTMGFFFGNPCDDYYRESDLEFIREARFNLFMGLKVFYNSSW